MQRSLSLFLCIYGLVYGSMHFYFYLSLRNVFHSRILSVLFFLPFSLFMILSPILLRLCESREWNCYRYFLAYSGYLWMGFLFLAISLLLVMDLGRLIQFILLRSSPFFPSVRTGFFISIVLSLFLCSYGYFEASWITTEELLFCSPKIMETETPFRIIQISDVHLGLLVNRRKLEGIVELINNNKPDLVISTGDLVDGQGGEMDGFSTILASIDAPFGKYAVTGNHEFYRGIEYSEGFTRKAGFRILRNSAVKVTPFLTLAGIDDPAGAIFDKKGSVCESELLENLSGDSIILLLKHQPRVESASSRFFDLQLSGHIHGGQIFPFSFLTFLAYRCGTGLKSLGKGQYLYVSPGTGTWGPPLRFLAPPKITVIDLKGSEDKSSIEYRR